MLRANVSPDGDLNNDSFLRALLQLRNTPDPDCGMSPAEIVFGRPLRDAFSFVNRLAKYSNHFVRRTWRETWKAKEDALRLRAGRNSVALQKTSHSLPVLSCGDRMFIQNQTGNYLLKWDKVGTIMEALTFDRYVVKVSGSDALPLAIGVSSILFRHTQPDHHSPTYVKNLPSTRHLLHPTPLLFPA